MDRQRPVSSCESEWKVKQRSQRAPLQIISHKKSGEHMKNTLISSPPPPPPLFCVSYMILGSYIKAKAATQ